MSSVTGRIKGSKQPRGGYINPRSMECRRLDDGRHLHANESIHSSIAGLAVDYLSRLANGATPQDAFAISLLGAELLGVEERARAEVSLARLTSGVLPDGDAVEAACCLAGYDVAFRVGPQHYNPDARTQPDGPTVENIQTMVVRAVEFFAEYGPVTLDGFTFPGGYTDIVTSGDGDFLTSDTLWDFKVSVNEPTKNHTLQLLMYYLMGNHSGQTEFETITHLGLFNPRLNTVYRIAVTDVPAQVIEEVAQDVIGYC